MKENMRGLFFIVKGSYKKECTPRFWNEVSESHNYIGGYDPERDTTEEWYMLYDCETFKFHGASSTLKGVEERVYSLIKRYKTKECLHTSVEVSISIHSPTHQRLMEEVYNTYGDYFSSVVKRAEDKAYSELRNNTPARKARNRFNKRSSINIEMVTHNTPATPQDTSSPTPPSKGVKKARGLRPTKRKVNVELQ